MTIAYQLSQMLKARIEACPKTTDITRFDIEESPMLWAQSLFTGAFHNMLHFGESKWTLNVHPSHFNNRPDRVEAIEQIFQKNGFTVETKGTVGTSDFKITVEIPHES